MPKPMALVQYSKCDPAKCPDGICPAKNACTKKVLKQDAPYEKPYRISEMCQGCTTCVSACPLGAIILA